MCCLYISLLLFSCVALKFSSLAFGSSLFVYKLFRFMFWFLHFFACYLLLLDQNCCQYASHASCTVIDRLLTLKKMPCDVMRKPVVKADYFYSHPFEVFDQLFCLLCAVVIKHTTIATR